MNRERLSVVLASKCNLTKAKAREILDCLTETMADELLKNEDVLLVGFGRFSVRERAARKGRNPKTGQEIKLPTTRSIGFIPSKGFRFALQGTKRK